MSRSALIVHRLMIVGVDYTAAAWQSTGIGRYTRELVRAAVAKGGPFRYVLFYAARGLPTTSAYLNDLRQLCTQAPQVRAVPIPLSPRLLTILWQRLRLPLYVELLTGRLDLVFGPDFVLPPTRARTLLTIHDVTFLINPEWFEASFRRYLNSAMPHSLRRANLILADSQATRTDLARLMNIPLERIAVVYLGVSSAFRSLPASVTEPVRQRLKLPQDFLLFVSTLEPRKNLGRLLEALHQLDPALHLAVAGHKGWLYDEIFAIVERLGLQSRVHFLGSIVEDLPALYNLAQAFIYPSLYEGFGAPVVEAMACGTPVVTSNVSSMPEVAGDAAVLVDPLDSRAIAEGIRQALTNAQHLRAAGPVQARRFTWDQSADVLLECFERVMHDGR